MKLTSRVKGKWKYLYRAVDSKGNTLDFLLTANRDAQAAKGFFRKALSAVKSCQISAGFARAQKTGPSALRIAFLLQPWQ